MTFECPSCGAKGGGGLCASCDLPPEGDEYECWEYVDEEGAVELTFTSPESIADQRAKGLLSEDAVLLYSFMADNWDDAMREHHRRQGWEPYRPMEES